MDTPVDQGPTISVEGFAAILQEADSPIAPYASVLYYECIEADIDPAFMLAVTRKETAYGTHSGSVGRPAQKNAWALRKHSWGRGHNYPYSGFSYYDSYLDAGLDFIDLIAGLDPAVEGLYYPDNNTVAEIIRIYAPPIENYTALYIQQVETWMAEWSELYPIPDPEPDFLESLLEMIDGIHGRLDDLEEWRANIKAAS